MSPYLEQQPHHTTRRVPRWFWFATILLGISAYWLGRSGASTEIVVPALLPTPVPVERAGDLVSVEAEQTFTQAQTVALAKANYGSTAPPINTGITKYTFRYRSELPDGEHIIIHARAYLPSSPQKNLPIFAFATGTTGIGDACAPSVEQPKTANWANYDSHMAMYASQGFASVVTDYEGMRDSSRIHHYMVGELEGRAVLDSIRGLRNLPAAKDRLNTSQVFLAGYSQGGHAAYWADKIAQEYAPDIKPSGVIGFGPVMSVKQTLTDVVRAANINWFGPYVLFSYRDYYGADYGPVLLPRWMDKLNTDVPAHCIDTNLTFWGHTPGNVYTPEFLEAATTNNLSPIFADLDRDLATNEVAPTTTKTAKRVNQGAHDNVVLPSQQQAVAPLICQSSKGPFQLTIYPNANHYNTMVQSLGDTLGWMRSLMKGEKAPSTCPPQ